MVARILYILLAILLFGVLIAIHEFGHFFTAKLLGVKVNEFAIGMGPSLFSRRKGETTYSLRAFPIGGFCAMEGEDEDTGDPGSFSRQPGWKKIIILCAGSFMNFVLGLVIAMCIVGVRAPVITEFADGFTAQGPDGLMVGDRIISVDGQAIQEDGAEFADYSLLMSLLSANDGQGIDLVVERDGQEIVLDDLPMYRMQYTYNGETYTGFGLVFGSYEQMGPLARARLGLTQTAQYVRLVWDSLVGLVTRQISPSEMSGVIGIVDMVSEIGAQSDSVANGILNVLNIMALIAVNLAVINLLPIPALDGGRVLFVLLNGILYVLFRRRIPEKYEGYVHTAAFLLLIVLMVVIALHDVWNIIT